MDIKVERGEPSKTIYINNLNEKTRKEGTPEVELCSPAYELVSFCTRWFKRQPMVRN